MSHGNARTTFHGRLLIVERRRSGWTQAHIAAAMGISRKCVKTWIDRYAAAGEVGLHDRSSRPHSTPTRTADVVEARIVELRRRERRGPDWIGAELGVPARTVSRVLRRHQVPYLCECDPMTGVLIRSSKTTAVRYERSRPGEWVHMDINKIGRIPDGGGWRIHGREGIARSPLAKIGYDYVHSLVDDHSRLAYSEILPDEKGQTCADFRPAPRLLPHPRHHQDRTADDRQRLGIQVLPAHRMRRAQHRQVFIKPHCPWQNGKGERLNRTLQSEWAYRQVFTTNAERAAALAPWLEYYNTRRRHNAIGDLPPISRLLPT